MYIVQKHKLNKSLFKLSLRITELYSSQLLFILEELTAQLAVPAAGSPVTMFGCSSDPQADAPVDTLLCKERRKGVELPQR